MIVTVIPCLVLKKMRERDESLKCCVKTKYGSYDEIFFFTLFFIFSGPNYK